MTDIRFLERWLKEGHSTSFECPSCHNVFGPLRVSLGVTLTTYFDTDEYETAIKVEPFPMLEGWHPNHLVRSEMDAIMKKAQAWADKVYADAFEVVAV